MTTPLPGHVCGRRARGALRCGHGVDVVADQVGRCPGSAICALWHTRAARLLSHLKVLRREELTALRTWRTGGEGRPVR